MDNLKALEIELGNTRSALDNQAKLIDQIKAWLTEEVNLQQPIIDGEEILTDGTDDICEGRHECADGLLNQIEKWENE